MAGSAGTDRYCIIGAGPSGLAMALALRHAGVPYDQFERPSAVGGLWDLENPGSPMYESAHLISSKTMRTFAGFPKPAECLLCLRQCHFGTGGGREVIAGCKR